MTQPYSAAPSSPVLIFDFDGTLADSLDLVIREYNRVAPRFRAKLVDRDDLPRLRTLKASAAMREHNISFWKVPLLVSVMRRAMHDHVNDVKPCPNAVEAVRAVHRAGFRCSVLSTNSNANIERFIARHDLRVFEHIAGGSSMFGKARALRKLIRRAGFAPEQVYYVGDEVRDVEAAAAAGVRSIAVSWGYADRGALLAAQPTHLVDEPGQLLPLLTRA